MYLICELEDGSTSLNTCSKLAAAYCFFFCITFAMLQTEKKWTTCTSINFYSMLLQYAFLWNVPFHIFSVDAWSVLAMKLWIYCPAGVIVNAIWNEDSFWYVCTLNTLMAIFVAYCCCCSLCDNLFHSAYSSFFHNFMHTRLLVW
jgi:hypothetical protein